MAPKVPPISPEHFPGGSEVQASPRINEQTTPRALFEMVKDDQKWAVLLDDTTAGFKGGDIIDYRYQQYLQEVVPIMLNHNVSFKTAVDMLASRLGKAQGSEPKGSPKRIRKEVMKDQSRDPMPKLQEAIDEKDESMIGYEPKALDVDMQQKSLNRPRDFTKATGRASSEPITPNRTEEQALCRQQGAAAPVRPEPVAERVVYVETRPQVTNKAVAIQTEEAPPGLLQPLLARPVPKPKARNSRAKPKEQPKEVPIQYQDCSCGRICFSAGLKFLLACVLFVGLSVLAHDSSKVLAFFGGTVTTSPEQPNLRKKPAAAPAPVAKHKQTQKEPKREEPSSAHQDHKGSERHAPQKKEPAHKSELQLAKDRLDHELKILERLEEEETQTARVGELARLSQQENEKEAKSQNKDVHLRQAALDAEVQAKVAQQELKEDSEIQLQKRKVKDAQAHVDQLESEQRDHN